MAKPEREITETVSALEQHSLAAAEDITSYAKEAVEEAAHRAADAAVAAKEVMQQTAGRAKAAAHDGVEKASTALREVSASDVVGRTKSFAKEHPALFVAGLALAGFALTRVLRAGGSTDEAQADISRRVAEDVKAQATKAAPRQTAPKNPKRAKALG
ncbi:hypothetical protein [Pseudorhodobacter sp.]|uniref:hypothetical protein n=1 Tax=Pseudorhodobacter sp. TaxID=1934400 RepID=UPI002AFDEEBA|nr:hypothetical protein [Pseudorhodobacter sp.]